MARTLTLALLALLLTAGTASAEDPAPTPLPAAPGSEAAEPNGTRETATPIAAGGRIRATRTVGDVDLYRFTAEAGDRVYATVVTVGSAAGDSRLALLGPDGTELESDDDDGSFQVLASSIAGAAVPATGTYYLRVDSPDAAMRLMPYDLVLDVRTGAASAEVEPNGQTPQPLGDTRFVAGTKAANDVDLYTLELEAGDTVFLSLDLDPERDDSDVNGRLGFGSHGQLMVVNDGGNDGIPSEAWVGTVHSAGTYIMLVDAVGAAAAESGSYELSITVIRAVKRSCRTYTIEPADGAIPDAGSVTFPIDVPDPGRIDHVAVRLDLTHNLMSDLEATVRAPAGNTVALFDDIGSQFPGGPLTHLLATFDDAAGTAPLYSVMIDVGVQPEKYRLGWFAGQQAAGTWSLTLGDDLAQETGTLARADLVLCSRPEEGPVDTVFAAGFEDGDDGFEHSGTLDEWERGTPATPVSNPLAGLTSCGDGTGCFKTDLDGTYEANSSQDLVSPPISLAGRTGPIHASWDMWYQLEDSRFDEFTVSVEEDGGAGARPLFTWVGPDMIARQGIEVPLLGLSAGWGRHVADISEYAGKTIRLRFHLASDQDTERRGVAIDDVRVYQEAFALDVGVAGSGGGYVDSAPAGIDCGSDAAAHPGCSISRRGPVTLTAHPDAESSFAGFSGGGCSGTATTCTVTLDRARSVTATFDRVAPAPVGDPPAAADPQAPVPSPVAAEAPATAEPAISDVRLGMRCVRRTASGRVRVPMSMRLAQPGAIRVSIERAVGSKGRSRCPRANPVRDRDTRFRPVRTVRPPAGAAAAALTHRVTLNLRLRPGLYRLGVRVQLPDGRLSSPVRKFLRVAG